MLFDSTYRTFFFVDKHAEIAERFRMTYELYFEEGPVGANCR
jgi:hypothetical protein